MQESLYAMFLSLVQFDQETNILHMRVITLQKEMEVLKKEALVLQDVQEQAYRQWQEARKEVDAYELELQGLEDIRLVKQKYMEQAHSTKEHQALRKEIDLLLYKQNELEQKIIFFWNVVDTRRKAFQECATRVETERTLLQSKIPQQEGLIAELLKKINERDQEWQLRTNGLPEDLLQKYAMMRTTIIDPVVPVEQEACSMCYYALTHNDRAMLRKNYLMQCKGCFRLLYSLPSS